MQFKERTKSFEVGVVRCTAAKKVLNGGVDSCEMGILRRAQTRQAASTRGSAASTERGPNESRDCPFDSFAPCAPVGPAPSPDSLTTVTPKRQEWLVWSKCLRVWARRFSRLPTFTVHTVRDSELRTNNATTSWNDKRDTGRLVAKDAGAQFMSGAVAVINHWHQRVHNVVGPWNPHWGNVAMLAVPVEPPLAPGYFSWQSWAAVAF